MAKEVILGKRRFTCLSEGLVRMEFSPDGSFEDRRSLVASGKRKPIAFRKVKQEGGVTLLDTGRMIVVSREHDKAFFPGNLEVRWLQNDLLQYWRPGDRDHLNLGGTVFSLDYFCRYAELSGSHTADMQPPDSKGMAWIAEDICENDPWYYASCGKEDVLNRVGNPHRAARFAPDTLLVRTLNNTLDQHKYCPGIISRSGYFFLNDSNSPVMDQDDFPVERGSEGRNDWYFFCYGKDYKSALSDFILLAGRAPLPTKHTFGLFFSRWPAYDEKEAKEIVTAFARNGIPLSVLVIDMEWHKAGWCHWDWDEKMYPDPQAFFDWCHKEGLAVTLNVHPLHIREADSHFKQFLKVVGKTKGITTGNYHGKSFKKVDVNLCDKKESRAFMRVCHDKTVKEGLDFWWVDGSNGKINGAHHQLVTNKIFFENVETSQRRGMLLSRYGGLGSHRYGVYFTGDTQSDWQVMKRLCEFNIRAGHLGVAYVSHDTGGFGYPQAPIMDPVLYVRWLQFGVFSPVLRFHCGPGAGSRQPWDYGETNFAIAKKWLTLRNSLIPYIYTAARHHYDTGVPLVRGLFLEHPDDAASYRFDEYYFGDSILVAPVLDLEEHRCVYLPAGEWYEFATGRKISGGREFTLLTTLADIPLYVKAGSIVVQQTENVTPGSAHVGELLLSIYPGALGKAELYEDDGVSPCYKRKSFSRTTFELKDDGGEIQVIGHKPLGKVFGKKRKIILEVLLDAYPHRVLLDGKPLERKACAKSVSEGRYRIEFPVRHTSDAFKLSILR